MGCGDSWGSQLLSRTAGKGWLEGVGKQTASVPPNSWGRQRWMAKGTCWDLDFTFTSSQGTSVKFSLSSPHTDRKRLNVSWGQILPQETLVEYGRKLSFGSRTGSSPRPEVCSMNYSTHAATNQLKPLCLLWSHKECSYILWSVSAFLIQRNQLSQHPFFGPAWDNRIFVFCLAVIKMLGSPACVGCAHRIAQAGARRSPGRTGVREW